MCCTRIHWHRCTLVSSPNRILRLRLTLRPGLAPHPCLSDARGHQGLLQALSEVPASPPLAMLPAFPRLPLPSILVLSPLSMTPPSSAPTPGLLLTSHAHVTHMSSTRLHSLPPMTLQQPQVDSYMHPAFAAQSTEQSGGLAQATQLQCPWARPGATLPQCGGRGAKPAAGGRASPARQARPTALAGGPVGGTPCLRRALLGGSQATPTPQAFCTSRLLPCLPPPHPSAPA